MEMKPVESSNVAKVGHDPETEELVVEFKTGATYAHDGVPPELHEAFMNADSKGRFYNSEIKGKFPHRKIG